MVQPINYMALIPQPNLGDELAGLGQELRRIRGEKKANEQMQVYQQDLERTFQSGKPEDFAALIAKYPQQREAFKDSWDILSKGQQDNEFKEAVQVYQALQTNPEVAKQLADERILATENSGGDTTNLKQIRQAMDVDPQQAANYLAFTLSSIDPDKWSNISTERREAELAPSKLTESQAKAEKAAVDAKFAESNAALDLQKKGWDIQKIQNDISVSRQNSRIAAMNAKLASETNDLKRAALQQKINDAQSKRDSEVREKAANLESARGNIDNMLNTADRILGTPIGVIESATGPISSRLPTLSEDTADFEALMENIDAQAFLSQIPNLTGMGALSDAEGKRITAALQNFSLKQSPGRLTENVKEAQRLLLKARQNLADKHGVPETIPDTPSAVQTPASDIDALIQQYAPGG